LPAVGHYSAFDLSTPEMKQAIPGVSPASISETRIMTVWPSISMFGIARVLGRGYVNRTGWYVFTFGNILALALAPLSAALYLFRVLPFVGERYTLTNRRVVIHRGIPYQERQSVALDRFDSIEIHVGPGHVWYHAGDLVFRQGEVETFRLAAVSRPEGFRQACLKARTAYVGVKKAMERETAAV
jgi:hypothetical protein